MTSDPWWSDEARFQAAVMQHGTPTQAARVLGGISERSARERYQRLQDAGSVPSSVRATSAPVELEVPDRWTPEQVLEGEGLDPADYIITHVKPNRWEAVVGEGEVREMHQLKVVAQRRVDTLLGITLPDDWQPPTSRALVVSGEPTHIPLFGDPHFPLHEPALYEASLAWIEQFKPSRMICMGDEGDWSPFKRHRINQRTDVTPAEALVGTFNGLAGWAYAAGSDCQFDLIPGNHTKWLENRILEKMPELAGFTRPGDNVPMHSLRHVLKLDELGITYHDTLGEYFDSQIQLAPDLVLMHGVKTGKHGGAITEHGQWEGVSVCQGHDHSLQLTAISKRDAEGHTQRYAISTGAMSKRDLGYSSAQDVDQGFAVITLWPDGKWHPDFALYNPQTQETTWRDWRFG